MGPERRNQSVVQFWGELHSFQGNLAILALETPSHFTHRHKVGAKSFMVPLTNTC